MDPIRVCIGTEPRTVVPCKVLEFSILRNVAPNTPVEFHHLSGGDWKDHGPLQQYTGFSFLRWTIAEKFAHEGKAIYLDADQLCLTDISQLWQSDKSHPHEEACIWSTYYSQRRRSKLLPFLRVSERRCETSVMLIDCARAKEQLMSLDEIYAYLKDDPDREKYFDVMHVRYLKTPPQEISSWWNVMDGRGKSSTRFRDPQAKILHYTEVDRQPWYCPENPNADIWEGYLQQALAEGYVTQDEVRESCQRFSLDNQRPDGMHPYWKRLAA